MNITVVGGGNIGTQFAVHSAEKGHSVRMLTSGHKHFSKHLTVVDRDGCTIHEGDIELATSDPQEAFSNADMIMITMPPTMMIPMAQIIYDHTDSHTMIGFIPGNGGFEFAFRDCIERGNVFFGIDRVPAIARLTERGKTVCCSGYKDQLYVGAIPSSHTEECAALIESIFDIPCVRLPGFMALTLTPSNPILHTARLRIIFADYEPGVTYGSLPLFYEDWDDPSSELLLACDDEIQDICRALPGFGLEYVVSEREFYNADTAQAMTQAISTEASLQGITTPSVIFNTNDAEGRGLAGFRARRKQRWQRIEKHIQRRQEWREHLEERRCRQNDDQAAERAECRSVKDTIRERFGGRAELSGLIPDLHSRYFTADFPYGLAVIQQIGKIAGVSTPNIDSLIEWYDNIAIVNDKLHLADYGVTNMDDLNAFYLQ